MKSRNLSFVIIAMVAVFVCTCFAVAFAIGRKEKVASGKMIASGSSTSGVAKIIDEDFGYINVEWDLQEKEKTAEFSTYILTATAIFTPGKAAVKAGERYGKWKCKSGYMHIAPVCDTTDIKFVNATPLALEKDNLVFNAQKGGENEKKYQWSFRFNERNDEIFVLPAKYEFCVTNGADISALSFQFDLKMAVCRGFYNRAIATSFNTANINVSA